MNRFKIVRLLHFSMAYEFIDHTADVMFQANARTIPELFLDTLNDCPTFNGNAKDNAPSITRYSPVMSSLPFDDHV